MPPLVASTQCHVQIVAPNGARFDFRVDDYEQHLLAVETHKDLGEACGSFTLHMTAIRDQEGRCWDQLIPKRSLVTISMERSDVPGLETESTVVMVGLTDTHSLRESWEQAQPRRTVTISGRELSCLLLDAQLVFHPMLLANPEIGVLTVQTVGLGKALALAWNPSIATGGESPIETLGRLLDYFLFVGGAALNAPPGVPTTQHPIIQVDLPHVALPELLQKNKDAWNTFEPGVQVPMPYQTSDAGSLWNYLHLFIDRPFQEFFTRIEDGVCKIHFRGKPFAHERVREGTRFKSAAEEPTLRTLTLDPADLLAQQTQCSTTHVYNFFLVSPLGIVGHLNNPNLRYRIMPQVVTDPSHPSFVGRYGLRVMSVESHYLPPFVPIQSASSQSASVVPLARTPSGAAQYAPLATQIAAQQGIPAEHRPAFVALIHAESAFNPNAVSSKGAQGLGQLMPETAAQMGVSNPFDPVQSLTGAAKYWNYLRSQPYIGNDTDLIVAGYNAGPGAVQTHKGIPPFRETQKHVEIVNARKGLYAGTAGTAAVPPPTPAPTMHSLLAETDIIKTAQRWAAILAAWHDMGGELFAGTLTVRGHPAWNIGHRLVCEDERGEWEAYIEGVQHRYDMRTGQYLTQLRISRGWYLSAAVARQAELEGQTTITQASGGPPTLDPKTGEPEEAPSRGEVTVIFEQMTVNGQVYRRYRGEEDFTPYYGDPNAL